MLVELNVNPGRRELRVFGAGFTIALVVIGALLAVRGKPWVYAGIAWAIGAICAALAAFVPLALKWPYVAVSIVTYPIGIVVSWIALALLFYG